MNLPRIALLLAAPALFLSTSAPARAVAVAPAAEERLPHISVVTIGERGPPVILIPGLASPRAVWDGVAPKLARDHRVYLVQVNGFAGDDPGDNLKADILAGIVADLARYIVAHKLKGAAVVGHSMGGLLGMMLARDHGDLVGRLMVVDALPFFAVIFAPPGVDPSPAAVAPQAAAMRDRLSAAYGKPADPQAIAAQTRGLALKPASIAQVQRWAAAADPRVTAQALYADLTTDLRADLPRITVPMMIVYPWNTESGPAKALADPFYRKQYAAAPKASFVDIGDAAHFMMLDQPAAFATALDRFIAAP